MVDEYLILPLTPNDPECEVAVDDMMTDLLKAGMMITSTIDFVSVKLMAGEAADYARQYPKVRLERRFKHLTLVTPEK